MECTGCGATVGRDHLFCAVCGAPAGRPDDAGARSRVERPDAGAATVVVEPVRAPAELTDCPRCGAHNSVRRERCARCGGPLAAASSDDGAVTGFHDPMGLLADERVPEHEPRPTAGRRRAVAALLLGLGAVGVGAAAVFGTGVLDLDGTDGVEVVAPGFDASRYPAEPVTLDVATMRASTEHEPIGDNRYDVALVLDGDLATAWNSDGDVLPHGVGEEVEVVLARPAWLVGIELANGYQKSDQSFVDNARPTRVALVLDGATYELELLDRPGLQAVTLDRPRLTTQLRIEVLDSARGQTYEDLALSELVLRGHPAVGVDVERAILQRDAVTPTRTG